MEYRRVRVRGLVTAYVEAGSPTAPALVLLHDGCPGSDALSCWQDLIPLLSDRFRVLAPDLIGAGRSEKVIFLDGDFYTHAIAQVAAFCDTLMVDAPTLVGASLGGGIVLHAMSRRAFSISAGVSIAGPGGKYMSQDGLAPIVEYQPTPGCALAVERTLVRSPEPEAVQARLANSLAAGHLESLKGRKIHGPSIFVQQGDGDGDPHSRMLSTIAAPTLLIAGAKDPLVDPSWAESLASVVSNATVVSFDEGFHLPHRDHPVDVAALLADHAMRHSFRHAAN